VNQNLHVDLFLANKWTHSVKTTSFGRSYDVKTVKLCRSNVVLTLCASE